MDTATRVEGPIHDEFQTQEPEFRRTLDRAFQIAATDAPVLFRGERGTGKQSLARLLHAHSPRAAGPFVHIACDGLTPSSLDEELFRPGYGAAAGLLAGKWDAADGGTIYFEYAELLPEQTWAQVLHEFRPEAGPGGSWAPRNVRLFASTLPVSALGRFREPWRADALLGRDFAEFHVPPLRSRPRDLLPLAHQALATFAARANKQISGFTPKALAAIAHFSWPGNLDELNTAVEVAVAAARGPLIGASDLPAYLVALCFPPVEVGTKVTLEQLELEHIRAVLRNTNSLEEAAAVLGVAPSTLYRKRKRYQF